MLQWLGELFHFEQTGRDPTIFLLQSRLYQSKLDMYSILCSILDLSITEPAPCSRAETDAIFEMVQEVTGHYQELMPQQEWHAPIKKVWGQWEGYLKDWKGRQKGGRLQWAWPMEALGVGSGWELVEGAFASVRPSFFLLLSICALELTGST